MIGGRFWNSENLFDARFQKIFLVLPQTLSNITESSDHTEASTPKMATLQTLEAKVRLADFSRKEFCLKFEILDGEHRGVAEFVGGLEETERNFTGQRFVAIVTEARLDSQQPEQHDVLDELQRPRPRVHHAKVSAAKLF